MILKPSTVPPRSKREMISRLNEVLEAGWQEMPPGPKRYNGAGGPGNYLEDLLGLSAGNQDIPDCVGWEVKFYTPKTALMTLFHKEPDSKDILRYFVSKYGWKDKQGRLSFRHTIKGASDRFKVVNDSGNIVVRPLKGKGPVPKWTHDTLLNVAGGKLRRLVAVQGRRQGRLVKFDYADLFEDLHITHLIKDIVSGKIAVDFDVREKEAGAKVLRNHGTKFRIQPSNLARLYEKHRRLS